MSEVLAPHLNARTVWTTPIVVETSRPPPGGKARGGGDWMKWQSHLRTLLRDNRPDYRVTTMVDLFRFPPRFPGFDDFTRVQDTVARAAALEDAMFRTIGDRRFIPNVVRHEFETLVLAALEQLAPLLEENQQAGLRTLMAGCSGMNPEDVNDGATTAPSKRLQACIKGYRKTLHGVRAAQGAGLVRLRSACPRFSAWVQRLEALAGPAAVVGMQPHP